jgi:SAM-dependent methyltransferase
MSDVPASVENLHCVEDLAHLAATQYRLADRYCDRCRNYHALFPYRRAARIVRTAETGGHDFTPILSEVFKSGRNKVLIAGAADSGLLALTARAGAAFDIDILVLDRCQTPLESCREFAQRHSHAVDVLCRDLVDLDVAAGFDVVVADNILLFIEPERRVEVLSRLRRALRPNGRIVHIFNVSARISGEVVPEYRASYSRWVIDELKRRHITLPEARDAFIGRLDDYAREFESRDGAFSQAEQVLALHESACFSVTSCVEFETALASPWKHFVSRLAKRRFVLTAVPKAGGPNG